MQISNERTRQNLVGCRALFSIVAVFVLATFCGPRAIAQQGAGKATKGVPSNSKSRGPIGSKAPNQKRDVPPRKLTDAEKAAQAVLNAYTDAANFQNGGAYERAIEAWQNLLKQYPTDALASKAKHYLAISYLQIEKPDYEKAISNFRGALEDPTLEVREESLVNLGIALHDYAAMREGELQKQSLQESSAAFAKFLDKFSDGSFADQAIFYAGDAEYQLGRIDRAISLFRRLVDNPAYAKSQMRSDAMYSIAAAYEEQQQPKLAAESYEKLLKEYPDHRYSREARLRLADQRLILNDVQGSLPLWEQLSKDEQVSNKDYVLYRYGYALAKAGRFAESSSVYKSLSEKYPDSQFATGSSLAAGQALMRDKKYDEAVTFFKQVIVKHDEPAAEAAHLLCQIAMMQSKPSEALAVARDAAMWGSKSSKAVALKMDLADALAADPSTAAESRTMYEQIAVENAEDLSVAPRAMYNVAFAAFQAGDSAEARRWSELFATRYKGDVLATDVAYIFAESTLQLGQSAEAATAFEQLIASEKDHPQRNDWKLRLAHARFSEGAFDKVVEIAKSTLSEKVSDEAKAEAHYLIGASLLKKDQYEQAIASLENSIRALPTWTETDNTLMLLAQAQTKIGKTDSAIDNYEKLIAGYPNSRFRIPAEFRLGQATIALGNVDRAIKAYDVVLASPAQNPELVDFAKYGKASALLQTDRFAEAIPLLEPIATADRDDALGQEAKLAYAVALRNCQRAADSVNLLKNVIEKTKSEITKSKMLYELGVAQCETQAFDEAITTFESLLSKYPKFEEADKVMYEYGWALKEVGKNEAAFDVFSKLSQMYPDSPFAAEADYNVGQGAYDSSKFERAIAAYTSAANKTNDESLKEKSLYKLGWSYFQQQSFEDAAKKFAMQISSYPKGTLATEATFMQAECEMQQQDFANAFKFYENARAALDGDARNVETVSPQIQNFIYLHGAQAARELKQWKTADAWLDEFMKRFPDSAYLSFVKYEQAISAQNQHDIGKAVDLFSAVAQDQRNEIGARSRFMLGELFFGEHDFARAVPEFERTMFGYGGTQASIAVKNWQARAAIEAGRCSEALVSELTGQRKAKAIQISKNYYQFVIEKHPEHELVGQAKTRVAELDRIIEKK